MSRLPRDQCERNFAGEVPLKVWREFRRIKQIDLRRATVIRVAMIEGMERGLRQPARAEGLKLARALGISAHDRLPRSQEFRGRECDDPDGDEVLSRGVGLMPWTCRDGHKGESVFIPEGWAPTAENIGPSPLAA